MKYIFIILTGLTGVFVYMALMQSVAAITPVADITIDGVQYTQARYDTKKSNLISDFRTGNIDISTRDLVILIEMIKRECAGKQLNPNGKLTWEWLINKFEQGC